MDGGPDLDQPHHRPQRPLAALSGTSSSRVFAAGAAYLPGMQLGTVLFWDGVGWTVEAIPAATPTLYGVWASPLPEGRVFAVGTAARS